MLVIIGYKSLFAQLHKRIVMFVEEKYHFQIYMERDDHVNVDSIPPCSGSNILKGKEQDVDALRGSISGSGQLNNSK